MRHMIRTLALALILASFITVVSDSPESYGAESSATIDGVSVQIFDQNSSDYSNLAYLSDMLPKSLKAAEWVRDPVDGYWYNIDNVSQYYGRVLTYGAIPGISQSEIRQDVLDHFSTVFLTDSFTVLQVRYVAHCDCQVSIEVTKNDLPAPFIENTSAGIGKAGVAFTDVDNYQLFTIASSLDTVSVDPAQVDIKPAGIRGVYETEVTGAGSLITTIPTTYNGANHTVSGYVRDVIGNPLVGVSIRYSIDEGIEQTVVTGADGSYRFGVKHGSEASITNVILAKYTFDTKTWASGTMIADKTAPLFEANERTVRINVVDASGDPVADARIDIEWYVQESTHVRHIVTDVNVLGNGMTGADGSAYVSVGHAPSGDHVKAYVWATAGRSGYTFEVDDGVTDVEAPLVYPGNAYLDLVTCNPVTLTAVERNVTVSAVGSGAGDSQVPYAKIGAVWLYQRTDGSALSPEYLISDDYRDVTEEVEGIITPGTARVVSASADYSGEVRVCYVAPVITDSKYSAFLYVYGTGADRPYAPFSFDAVDVEGGFPQGTRSVADIVSAHPGCAAVSHDAVADMTIRADQRAFDITVTVSGDVPDSMEFLYYLAGEGERVTIEKTGSTVVLKIVAIGGMTSTVELTTQDGYRFSYEEIKFETATSDMSFDVTSVRVIDVCERGHPVTVDTYTVNGLSIGDRINVSYQIAGIVVSSDIVAASASISIPIPGWDGNLVTNMKIIGLSGFYVEPIEGKTTTVHELREMRFVTYSDGTGAIPTVRDAVSGETVTVLVDGILYAQFTTGDDGTAVLDVPVVPGVSFAYGSYTLAGSIVTEGAFLGYTAFDLYDFIGVDRPVFITMTVKYTSSSSLDNTAEPAVIEIVTDPETVTVQVGTTKALTAPNLDGFEFSGWFIGGAKMAEKRGDRFTAEFTVTEDMAGMVAVATYSPVEPTPPEEKIDNTTLVLGLVSIAIAILAFAYVILQNRRY